MTIMAPRLPRPGETILGGTLAVAFAEGKSRAEIDDFLRRAVTKNNS